MPADPTAPSARVLRLASDQLGEHLRWARAEEKTLAFHGRPSKEAIAVDLDVAEGLRRPIEIDDTNLLVSVDGAVLLADLVAHLNAHGYLLGLSAPLPRMSVLAAANALTPWAEGALSAFEGVSVDGEAMASPRAPRAAVGPDALAGVFASPPLCLCARAYLRVVPRARVAVTRTLYPTTREAGAAIAAVMDEGRAFSIEAEGRFVRVVGATDATAVDAADANARVDARVDGDVGDDTGMHLVPASGRGLLPGDVRAIRDALDVRCRVVGAPRMGRLGALFDVPRPVVVTTLTAASDRLANALMRASREKKEGQSHGA